MELPYLRGAGKRLLFNSGQECMDSMKGIEEGKGVMQSVRMLVMCCRITLVLEVPSWIGFSTSE